MALAMPPASQRGSARTFGATAAFALGALGGWPFALVLALPYVWEEVLCRGDDARLSPIRAVRWALAVALAALLAVPIVLIDSLAYGRVTLVPLNTVLYNVLGRARGIGPELYGIEGPAYYIFTLSLGFAAALPAALAALPMCLAAACWLPARFTGVYTPKDAPATRRGDAFLLALRLLPAYLWLALLSLQPHKEERFMYPVYPLLCFNAAVAVYFGRAALEAAYLRVSRSPYRASQAMLFPAMTLLVLVLAAVPGVLRAAALVRYYGAPMVVARTLWDAPHNAPQRLCYAKDWHRFPSHFFAPPYVEVQFVRSAFRGILPHHFARGDAIQELPAPLDTLTSLWPWADLTRTVPTTVNERNEDEPDRYVCLWRDGTF